MHTAQLRPDQFEIEIDGTSSGVDGLFPHWHKHQRFGILIQEPLGAAGASLLIQALIATFFRGIQDSWGAMADRELPGPPVVGTYPEIYAFHVGRRHGDLGVIDFWPPYKEVTVEANPTRVLHEVNGRGITLLAIPEGAEKEHHFLWPEYRAFLWRTERVFSYSSTGRVPDHDISIRSRDSEVDTNANGMLEPLELITPLRASNPDPTKVVVGDYTFEGSELEDLLRWFADVEMRQYEVTLEERVAAKAAREAIVSDGHATETYRRRDADYALRRLVR